MSLKSDSSPYENDIENNTGTVSHNSIYNFLILNVQHVSTLKDSNQVSVIIKINTEKYVHIKLI
jgi:hypothetical protein